MLDTQADISLLKQNSIFNDVNIDSNDIVRLKGISSELIDSIGSTNIQLNFNEHNISHLFHIVDSEFQIPTDGILGKDFIFKYKCNIDFYEFTFTIRFKSSEITIPIQTGPQQDTIVIPPRCEVFRIFKIPNFNGISFIDNAEIVKDVFVSTTIAHDDSPLIRVLNISNETKTVSNILNDVTNIQQFDIYTVNAVTNDIERIEKLKTLFTKNTPKNYVGEILDICSEYSDIFALENDTLTTNNFYSQKLRVTDESIVYNKNYRLPIAQKDEITRQVNKLLENNLIEPSHSPHNSPIILVPKKSTDGNKKWRLCIDYRQLNKKLIPDKFPLPRIDEILDGLGKAQFFTIIDLFSGFHQIPIDESSRELTAFSTHNGIYQWKVLPFGLNIAPNSFCRMMSIAFSGLSSDKAFLYMDDIIVVGTSVQNHINNLKNVFEKCRKYNLKLNAEKCHFFRHEVTFLGHKCTNKGLLPDESKIECIKKYPRPMSKEEVKSFTAFANYYRRFIENYAALAKPLNELTRKSQPFIWSNDCENAFNLIRQKLMSPPILQYPIPEKEYTITVDASQKACSGVLSQKYDDLDLPISYISRSFEKGELNKPIIEKELLAIHFAITTFKPYVWGQHFVVKTDHKPLIHLYNLKDPTSKLSRIRLDLETFNFTIVHLPGKENVAADALSRITIENLSKIYENNVTMLMTTAEPLSIHIDVIKEIFRDNLSMLPITANLLKMQTRSMARSKIESSKNKSADINENIELKSFEGLGINHDLKSVPKIIMNDNFEVCAYNENKMICKVDVNKMFINGIINLRLFIPSFEKSMSEQEIKKVSWPLNDKIFNYCTVETFKEECNKKLEQLQIVLTPPIITLSDPEEIKELMQKYHEDPLEGGHFGQKKLLAKIKTQYHFKNMSKLVTDFVKNCTKCRENKIKSKTRQPMTLTKTPQKPFQVVIIDTIGPMTKTEKENEYAVTMICDLTKYLVIAPIPNKSANTVARAIVETLMINYGFNIAEIRTDQGTEYKNAIVKELCDMLKISHNFATTYHPQSVGSVERSHRTLNEYIRAYVTDMSEWDKFIMYFQYCYNIAKHSAFEHKFSPYELVFGRQSDIDSINTNTIEPVYNFENYAKELKFKLQLAHKQAKEFVEKSKILNKRQYDKNTHEIDFKINDLVMLRNEPYNKFKNVYSGPYRVTELKSPNAIITDSNQKVMEVHSNRLIKY